MNVYTLRIKLLTHFGLFIYQKLSEVDFANLEDSNFLDFGSEFGITANYYAQFHNVVAIEPDVDMIVLRFCENQYTPESKKLLARITRTLKLLAIDLFTPMKIL